MTQWQPSNQPSRASRPPAVPPQFQQGAPPQPYRQPQQPQFQPAYQQPPYWPQPPAVQVNVQQNAYGPGHAYTRRGLGPFWTIFHLFMTCATCGLWIPIWVWHSKSRNSVTSFR